MAFIRTRSTELRLAWQDKGSDFRLTLPRSDKSLALEQALESVRREGETLHDLSIMVIDDERDVREGMRLVLVLYEYQVVAVESASSALEFIWLP